MAEKVQNIPYLDTESATDTECNFDKHDEGGSQAWLTVLGSFLVYYSSFGIVNSFGFFQDYYQKDYLSKAFPSTISIIGTLQLALMNLESPVAGGLCDAYGVRYSYVFSGLGTTTALLALSFCPKGAIWGIFLTQGLLMGIAVGFGTQPACTVVAQHFEKKRALATGLVSAGSALGGVCFSIMFTQLQPMVGFQWTMRIAAIKVIVCYSIALLISTDKPSGKKVNLSALLDFRGFFDARYAVLALGGCFANFGLWVPGFHIINHAKVAFPGYQIGPYLQPLMSGSSIPGMILGGLVGDRFGRTNVLFLMTLLSGFITLFIWLLAPSIAVLALFASLFGFTSGAVLSLLPPAVGQISPNGKVGARIGAFYSVISVATLTGTPIGAAMIGKGTKKEDYRGLIAFSGSAMLIGSLVLFAARLLHSRDLRKRW